MNKGRKWENEAKCSTEEKKPTKLKHNGEKQRHTKSMYTNRVWWFVLALLNTASCLNVINWCMTSKPKHKKLNKKKSAKCNKWSERATVHENPMNEILLVDGDDASTLFLLRTSL